MEPRRQVITKLLKCHYEALMFSMFLHVIEANLVDFHLRKKYPRADDRKTALTTQRSPRLTWRLFRLPQSSVDDHRKSWLSSLHPPPRSTRYFLLVILPILAPLTDIPAQIPECEAAFIKANRGRARVRIPDKPSIEYPRWRTAAHRRDSEFSLFFVSRPWILRTHS